MQVMHGNLPSSAPPEISMNELPLHMHEVIVEPD